MQEYKAEDLAVVDKDLLAGIVTENLLLELDDLLVIETLKENFLQYKVSEGTHLFDVLKISVENTTFFLPVVNSENEYIGITTPQKLFSYWNFQNRRIEQCDDFAQHDGNFGKSKPHAGFFKNQ